MAWVPISESGLAFDFVGGSLVSMDGSTVSGDATDTFGGIGWEISFTAGAAQVRVTVQSYFSPNPFDENPSYFSFDGTGLVENEITGEATEFLPNPVEFGGPVSFFSYNSGGGSETSRPDVFVMLVEVWIGEDVVYKFSNETLVHELDRGWSFDGQYIPHFLELNWFFGEDPITYKSVSKIRIHGLTKGVVNLQVALSGMQGDVATDYLADYMQPEFLDLPFTPIHISSEFVPCTNYIDYSDRGLALQMKFEGRNTDITLPEPAHVVQVLALQSSPQGNGKTAN